MKQSSVRFLNLLLSLLLLIATIFVYSLLLSPAYDEVNRLRGDLFSKSDLLAEQKGIVEKVKQMLDKHQGLTGPRQAISFALPNREEYPAFINQLSSLANAYNLTLESISLNLLPYEGETFREGGNVPVLGILRATMDLKGSYDSIKNFLKSVETNIRIMDPVRLSIVPATGGGDNFSYNVVVNGYYQSL